MEFLQQDIRNTLPDATFHPILCRNLVFTYFTRDLQDEVGREIVQRLKPGGGLVIGLHEKLPETIPSLVPWLPGQKIYRKED